VAPSLTLKDSTVTPFGDAMYDNSRDSLTVTGIRKAFGHVVALDGANLKVPFGKVTALVGDNGAGKSSLVKVISGVYLPDEGTIQIGDDDVTLESPNAARRIGIHTVYQDLALADNLDVVENLFLGSELRRQILGVPTRFIDRKRMEAVAEDLLDRLGITTIRDLRSKIESLSGGQRQTVAIARAMRESARVVILDEPTAALGVKQSRQVQKSVLRLCEEGAGVLVISHNLREVFEVADYIAVMRLGRVVRVFEAKDATEEEVVSEIVGISNDRQVSS
jgi:D-xylose transport system ATP-binding protein